MKFIRPKPISKTNKLIPKSYVVVKSFCSPSAFLQTFALCLWPSSNCHFVQCDVVVKRQQETEGRFREKENFYAAKQNSEIVKITGSNVAYGRSEYTMLLCASCILFIVRATNYCIVSPMTHFFVSQWSLGI